MRDEIIYFTPAEYGILMGLTGTAPYYAVSGGPQCTVEDYRRAYGSLYQRGYLARTGDGFALTDQGELFRQIRAARRVLVLSSGEGGTPKLYYAGSQSGWLVEWEDSVLSPWYRVQEMDRKAFAGWLRDSELLERPVIPGETAALMDQYAAEVLQDPSGPCVFRLECHEQGKLLFQYALRHSSGMSILCCRSGETITAEIYTEDSARRMLDACLEGESA